MKKVLTTTHMGSMPVGCRVRMEVEVTEEVVRFEKGQGLKNSVPGKEHEAGM